MKTKKVMTFKTLEEILEKAPLQDVPLDGNLAVADFEKMQNNQLAQLAFEALDKFRETRQRIPEPWNAVDIQEFVELAKKVADSLRYKESGIRPVAEWSTGEKQPELKLLSLFAATAAGVFNPLCAFQGGVVAQEVVKAIT